MTEFSTRVGQLTAALLWGQRLAVVTASAGAAGQLGELLRRRLQRDVIVFGGPGRVDARARTGFEAVAGRIAPGAELVVLLPLGPAAHGDRVLAGCRALLARHRGLSLVVMVDDEQRAARVLGGVVRLRGDELGLRDRTGGPYGGSAPVETITGQFTREMPGGDRCAAAMPRRAVAVMAASRHYGVSCTRRYAQTVVRITGGHRRPDEAQVAIWCRSDVDPGMALAGALTDEDIVLVEATAGNRTWSLRPSDGRLMLNEAISVGQWAAFESRRREPAAA